MEDSQFTQQIQSAITQKQEWFNTTGFPELLNQYRLLSSCVRNLFDMLKKKALVNPDPYSMDKRISDVVLPDTSPFSDAETANVLGERLSDYDAVLDFICNYYRFSTETLTPPTIKKLMDLNVVIDWANLTINSSSSNTRALATILNQARLNAPAILVSMITDCTQKGKDTSVAISKSLQEIAVFQKELYKGEIRKFVIANPEFNKEKAYASPDAELAEIKRLFTKSMGKRPFYSDLVSEVINEDQGNNKDFLKAEALRKLAIHNVPQKQEVKRKGPDTRQMLIDTVMAIGGMAPTLDMVLTKLRDNFDVFYANKTSFFEKLGKLFKKMFHAKTNAQICVIKIIDQKTGSSREQKLNIDDFLYDLAQKIRVYNGIGTQGMEFQRVIQYPEDKIFNFVCKQISECQSLYTIINSLDSFFKTEVDIINRPKIKGFQIDLSALRNSIVTANKKRADYQSVKEESEQMSKLGIK